MLSINKSSIPDVGLLNRYSIDGAYADCFTVEVSREISHQEFVKAFYTTKIFKLERIILKWLVSKPSTDEQVNLLAADKTNEFAAWSVEARCNNQLLLCDYQGRTRSWLMVEPYFGEGERADQKLTRLYFGSAIVPTKNKKNDEVSLGLYFKLMLCFHTLYSQVLLASAKKSLVKIIKQK